MLLCLVLIMDVSSYCRSCAEIVPKSAYKRIRVLRLCLHDFRMVRQALAGFDMTRGFVCMYLGCII